jgi:rod shape-determining protein MreD
MNMSMPRGQQLLLPANPLFIWGSLLLAFVLNMIQNQALWGRAVWSPDLVALVLLFWGVHQPRRIGVGAAFLFGLLMDVHQGSVLGQHALAYSVLNYLAFSIHRRLFWFTVSAQALQIFPLLLIMHAVAVGVRMMVGGGFPGALMLLAPVLESLLWPVATVLLLLPQRRAPDPDANRPL